ncbi:MAG TPA: family 16 glycoside hydrolase, partial [Planctomycetota bacterium]|nr:family 16 glycoside hydrolase [Planctomycetota bacterium]
MRTVIRPLFVLIFALSSLLADAPEGFTPLFNGKDLSGWKGLVADPPARSKMTREELAKAQEAADKRMREHWKAVDGILVYDGDGDSLCTARDYGDFELLVDWKIQKDGDSGVYLRGSPQVQIWDNPVGSGGLFNNERNPSKPLVKADKPVGEWNTFRIKMAGDRVTVQLNGTLVVDGVVLENHWERARPIYPAGQIELQHHGNRLEFRNIFIRELLPEAVSGGAGVLKKGGRIAVVGDSITEQKLYSRYIENYLLAGRSDLDLRVIQLGWSGERAPGFAARMGNDLLPWRPDVVTTCYGMNDGQYRPYEPSIGEAYRRAMKDIVSRLKDAGAVVVVGS